jgi:hypothetical protein
VRSGSEEVTQHCEFAGPKGRVNRSNRQKVSRTATPSTADDHDRDHDDQLAAGRRLPVTHALR